MSQLATSETTSVKPVGSTSPRRQSPQRTKATADAAGTITCEDIARLAFTNWQKRGCPTGDALRDWFAAEVELKSPRAVGGRTK